VEFCIKLKIIRKRTHRLRLKYYILIFTHMSTMHYVDIIYDDLNLVIICTARENKLAFVCVI
jgi:hypothetical protein